MDDKYKCDDVCNFTTDSNELKVLMIQIKREVKELMDKTEAKLLRHDGKIAELCKYLKDNLSNTIRCMLDSMQLSGELSDIITTTINNEIKLLQLRVPDYINVKEFGAIGDGVHDDTLNIQKAIDMAFNEGKNVYFPTGKYIITKPIHLWWDNQVSIDEVNKSVHIFGCGENKSIIHKITNTKSKLPQHEVDAIIIIANRMYKDGGISQNINGGEGTQCHIGSIKELSLEGSENIKNDYGIYSQGWYYSSFEHIRMYNVKTGMYCQTWNCYSNYYNIEINFADYGFSFGNTQIGGQTTMNFKNCHLNGIGVLCFDLRGLAYLENTSIDGSCACFRSIAYKRNGLPNTGANVKIMGLHIEGDTSRGKYFELSGKDVIYTIYNSNIELTTDTNDVLFYLRDEAELTLHDYTGEPRWNKSGKGVMKSIYDIDLTSRITFNNGYYDKRHFKEYSFVNKNIGDENIVVCEKNYNKLHFNKFISYIPSDKTNEKSILTTDIESNMLVLKTENEYGNSMNANFLITNKKYDLTPYSKIRVNWSFDLMDSEGTAGKNAGIRFFNEIIEDGHVSVGTPLEIPYTLYPNNKNPYNFNVENKIVYFDISNIEGEYYLDLFMSLINGKITINEISLLR